MAFDPDQYLQQPPAQTPVPAASSFDPDAYINGGLSQPASADVWARSPVAATPTMSGLIAGQPVPDKYQQAAIAERDRLLKAGVPLPEGYTRRLASGPLLGWGDELSAAGMTPFEMIRQGTLDPREGYRYAKAREDLAGQAAQENTGYLGDAAQTIGALATLPGNVFGRQAAVALGGAGKGVLPALGRMAGYGAESATLGAIQGAGNAPTMADVPEAALWGGGVSAALGAPFGAFAKVAPVTSAVTPSGAELTTLGARDYRARDALPVRYDTGKVADRLDAVRQANWNKYGLDTPQTDITLRDLGQRASADAAAARALNASAVPPGTVVPPGVTSGAPNSWQAVTKPRDISSLRRLIYEGGAAGSPMDERAGTIASKVVDRILTRPDPAMLAQGDMRDAAAAALLQQRGRGNFAAAYRSNAVTDAVDRSLADAAGQHSGLNFENILRQNLKKAQRSDQFGTFNPAEEAGVEQLIRGTTRANNWRELGNMLGGGGGLGRMVAMGTGGAGGGALTSYLYGGDPIAGAVGGLGLGLAGRTIRTAGNRAAQSAAERFAEQLRQRSPEYATRLAAAPMRPGPGLSSPMSGARTTATVGAGGNIRDAIAAALQYQLTGKRPGEQ